MKVYRLSAFFIAACTISLSLFAQPMSNGNWAYPQTKKGTISDNYFGTVIADPYRWLENDTATEVKTWVDQQNQVTQGYLSQIPYRQKIKDRLRELWNYERYTAPVKKGSKYYFYKNDGLQNQGILYVLDNLSGEPRVLLDPNKLSADGTVSLGSTSFSKDGRYMGYIIQRSGSDWQEIYVLDVTTGKRTTDSLRWVKFSGISWRGKGFYYSRFSEPKKGSELSAQNDNQKIYYHKLGNPQSGDELVYSDPSRPKIGWSAQTTTDETCLIIYGTEGASSGEEMYFMRPGRDKEFKKLNSGFKSKYGVVDNLNEKLLIMTDVSAPRYRLVLMDPQHPEPAQWQTVIPEKEEVLQNANTIGGKIIAVYMKDAANRVYQYNVDGVLEHEIALPTFGGVGGFEGEKTDMETFYSFTSFTYPPTVFRYDIASGKSEIFRKPDVKFNPDEYQAEQVFYPSKDGTKVPMFIVYKKGLKKDGSNPTYLYGYGGFNVSLNPSFSVTRLILLENGGVFALANLRGGGEYGESWHKAGMLDKKQNVFDDFIAAAEYLVKEKYTSNNKLAIAGGSNGGLLVGACMTQRPDLYKVCFPAVGVMDMLRYHKFTIGYAWASEYGSSDSARYFKNLLAYSPVHNIKPGISYPATLVTTADHDDRVVPAHSFKFISGLQAAQTGPNPVLIRIETKAGHGAGKPTSKLIDEWADTWSFFFYNIGVDPRY